MKRWCLTQGGAIRLGWSFFNLWKETDQAAEYGCIINSSATRQRSSQSHYPMHRPTVGIIALSLLLLSLGLYWQGVQAGDYAVWMSAFLRVGLVMAALWLAHPQLSRLPRWILGACIGGVFIALLAARNLRTLGLGLVVLIIAARLRPRT